MGVGVSGFRLRGRRPLPRLVAEVRAIRNPRYHRIMNSPASANAQAIGRS